MKSLVERLKSVLTYSEIKAINIIAKELDGKYETIIVMSNIADKLNIAKSLLNSSVRLLALAGVIETISMGAKGTYVKVLDSEVLKEVANM